MDLIKINDAKTAFYKAAEQYCGRFDIDDVNKEIINEIILYLDRDEAFNKQSEFGLRHINKGIMLIGNPGGGKTTIIEIMQALLRKTPLGFIKKSTAEITDEFAKSGPEFLKTLNGNVFFDDLGFERTAVHYGDKRELMQDVIFSRYDQMRYNGSITHFTSMSGFTALKEKYGEFAWSRLKQMCNIFVLGGQDSSIDRRAQNIVVQRPNINTLPRIWVTQKEYDEAMDVKRIKESYERIKNEPRTPHQFKGIGSLIRERLDELKPNDK